MTFTKHDLEPLDRLGGLSGRDSGDDEFEEQTFCPGQSKNFESRKLGSAR